MIISSKALHVLTYPYLQCNLKGLYDIKLYNQWCDLSNVYTAFAHAYFTSRAVFIFSNPSIWKLDYSDKYGNSSKVQNMNKLKHKWTFFIRVYYIRLERNSTILWKKLNATLKVDIFNNVKTLKSNFQGIPDIYLRIHFIYSQN